MCVCVCDSNTERLRMCERDKKKHRRETERKREKKRSEWVGDFFEKWRLRFFRKMGIFPRYVSARRKDTNAV